MEAPSHGADVKTIEPARRPVAWRGVLWQVGALFVLPNVFFYILARQLFLFREPVNVDYLLLGCVFPFAGAGLTSVAAGCLALIDFLDSGASIFHFTDVNVLQSLDDLALLWGSAWLPALGLLGAVVLFGLATHQMLRRSQGNLRSALGFFLVAVMLAGADHILVFSDLGGGQNVKRTTSALADVGFSLSRTGLDPDPEALDSGSTPTAATDFLFNDADSAAPHVVLTIVESWGSYASAKADSLQLEGFRAPELQERYVVETGTVPFAGSTVAAEFRELCRLRYLTEAPDMTRVDERDCLPARLARRGYATVAIHGFHRRFFDRAEWYPELGFETTFYQADLHDEAGLTVACGRSHFRGLCDPQVADFIREYLKDRRHGKVLLYWLTLNGHIPLGRRPASSSDLACDQVPVTERYPAICRLARTHDAVLDGLVELALDRELPRAVFVIVGDHAPAFTSRRLRENFKQAQVPYVVLWPK